MDKYYKIFTDGGSRGNPGKSGIGVFITDASDNEVFSISKFLGIKTNNEAEYLAFLESVLWLREKTNGFDDNQRLNVEWYLDSKLVVEQLSKRWKIKEDRLQILAKKCWENLDEISKLRAFSWSISHIDRSKNSVADSLANKAMDLN